MSSPQVKKSPKKGLTQAQVIQRRQAAQQAAERRRIAKLDAEFEEWLSQPVQPLPELSGMNYIAPQQQAQPQPTNRVITYITKSLKEQKKGEALIHSPSDVLTWRVNIPYINERSDGIDQAPTTYDFVNTIGNDTSYSYAIMVEYSHNINTIPLENVVEVSKTGRYVYNTPNNTHVVINTPVMYDFPDNTYSPEKAQQFMRVLLGQYPEERAYYIKLYVDEAYPQPFELFTAIDGNCVMNVIADYIAKNPTYMKKKGKVVDPQPLFNDILASITPEHGFTITHAKQVYSKLELNLVIHHNGGIWYDAANTRRHKTITIFAHDKHATVYRPVIKPVNVVYVPEEQYGLTIQDHAPTVVYGSVSLQHDYDNLDYKRVYFNIKAYQQGDTVYKSFRPPAPDDTNAEYYLSNSMLSYAYKKWKKTHNLRAPSDPYYEVIRSSEHLLGTQCFLKNTGKELYLCDINKAYPSFQTHALYTRFKLPLGYYNMGVLKDMTTLEVVSLTGWSRVSNITLNHQLLTDIAYLQEGCVYTHVRLYHILVSNLASFTIDMTIVSQPEHIEMPFLTDTILTDTEKRFNNAFIGNMIASNKENKKYYTSEDPRELEQIVYDAKKDENTLYATRISEKVVEVSSKITEKKGLYNVHSYIIDYAQTIMIDGMVSQYDKDIVAFHTDGFFTEKEPTIVSSRVWGAFKVERKRINFESKDTAPVHRQVPIPTYLPEITPYSRTLTIGPPGSGKSRQVFTNGLYSSILTCPTHNLKNTHKDNMKTSTLPDRRLETYHKYFQLGCAYERDAIIYENIYIDECSMISKEVLAQLHEFATKHRLNIHMIGDIDEDGIHQLPPVSTPTCKATPLEWSDFVSYNITRATGQRRQNEDDCLFLDSLRTLPYYQVLELVKKRVKTCSLSDVATLYTEDTLGVVSLHARAKVLNDIVYKRDVRDDVPTIRLRSTVNRKKGGEVCVATGELLIIPRKDVQLSRVFMDRTSATQSAPPGTMYELGYFNTCDAVQGMTHRGRLIIDTVGAHRENLLYTALTRATDLDNVYLIV